LLFTTSDDIITVHYLQCHCCSLLPMTSSLFTTYDDEITIYYFQ